MVGRGVCFAQAEFLSRRYKGSLFSLFGICNKLGFAGGKVTVAYRLSGKL